MVLQSGNFMCANPCINHTNKPKQFDDMVVYWGWNDIGINLTNV